jgi:hypothetical protein
MNSTVVPTKPVTINPSNRFGLDYAAEAASFPKLPYPIIDVHSHINGVDAGRLYLQAARLYGVGLTYSMSMLEQVPAMREIFGDTIRFIAVPNWGGVDKKHEMGAGFIDRIKGFHQAGCRIVKFWAAPRSVDMALKFGGDRKDMRLDAPIRVEAMKIASDLGMMFMTHVADPDTWFATKYADAMIYGSKAEQYEPLERLLDQFKQPWIAAHFGGSPESLPFLSGLLDRHPNLYLDTSAAKWIIREISKHPRGEVMTFLTKHQGRIMFGSDIVTMDEHLTPATDKLEMAAKASSAEDAWDLYASRYWALRKLWETDYDGESPIADPDLKMVEPSRFDDMSAPILRGVKLPPQLLRSLYHDAAAKLLA